MDIKDIDKKLQNEFAVKKINAEAVASKNLVLARSSEKYRKLDDLKRDTSFELGKEKAKVTADKNKIKELETALLNIEKLETDVLKSLGLSSFDLVANYDCKKCNDTGIVNGYVCSCYTKRRNQEIIKEYGLGEENMFSFDEINRELFSDEKQLSDYLKLKEKVEKWCDIYPKVKKNVLIFCGKTGVGKSFIVKCMAKRLIERNVSVCFVTAFQMNEMMLKYHTTFDSTKQHHLTPLLESDVLVIDDLGSEPIINNVTVNYLFNVLSERIEKNKATIVTTNLSGEDVLGRYKDRVFSRLFGKQNGAVFNLIGSDLRNYK